MVIIDPPPLALLHVDRNVAHAQPEIFQVLQQPTLPIAIAKVLSRVHEQIHEMKYYFNLEKN
jgi:hypothetical protein